MDSTRQGKYLVDMASKWATSFFFHAIGSISHEKYFLAEGKPILLLDISFLRLRSSLEVKAEADADEALMDFWC